MESRLVRGSHALATHPYARHAVDAALIGPVRGVRGLRERSLSVSVSSGAGAWAPDGRAGGFVPGNGPELSSSLGSDADAWRWGARVPAGVQQGGSGVSECGRNDGGGTDRAGGGTGGCVAGDALCADGGGGRWCELAMPEGVSESAAGAGGDDAYRQWRLEMPSAVVGMEPVTSGLEESY